MVDDVSIHDRKVAGVRFNVDASESPAIYEEDALKNAELQWDQYYDKKCSFELYFGILKLSHSYTMTIDVLFHHAPVKLETILDNQNIRGFQMLVTEFPQSNHDKRTSFQVEVAIHAETTPGPFHRTFLLKEASKSEEQSVTVNVRGKILRQGQGTATLRHGVRMKAIIAERKEDED